jgi:hypothetical protein
MCGDCGGWGDATWGLKKRQLFCLFFWWELGIGLVGRPRSGGTVVCFGQRSAEALTNTGVSPLRGSG